MKLSKFENVYFKTEGEDIFGSSVLNYFFYDFFKKSINS